MDAADRIESLLAEVHRLGPVVRRRSLRDAGHSPHTIRAAVDAGALLSVGRLWVARPGADPRLLSAARHGVVLTCVSAAQQMDLWTVDAPQVHVGVSPSTSRLSLPARTIVHWARPVVSRNPDRLTDAVENTLVIAASCLPREQALIIWESALRKGAVDPLVLGRMPLSGVAAALLAQASHVADSGLETIFRSRLRWLKVRIVPQASVHGRRVDFLVGDRLVVQIDGGHHVDAQRTSDITHDAELMMRGYHVIRIGYHQVMEDWPGVQDLIVQAIAQGLHRV